jgi:hypothetical protein
LLTCEDRHPPGARRSSRRRCAALSHLPGQSGMATLSQDMPMPQANRGQGKEDLHYASACSHVRQAKSEPRCDLIQNVGENERLARVSAEMPSFGSQAEPEQQHKRQRMVSFRFN